MIKIENISQTYLGKVLFQELSFKVNEFDKFAIKGSSGTGKSTLLLIVAGVIKPDSGKVFIDGQELNDSNAINLRRNFAWLPQNPNIIGKGIVRDIILSRLTYNQILIDDNEIIENFNFLHLDNNTLTKHTDNLSGGEKQRLAMIIAKLLNRKILLLDEPTSALDGISKNIAAEYLLQRNSTVISVSHDEEWIELMNNSITI